MKSQLFALAALLLAAGLLWRFHGSTAKPALQDRVELIVATDLHYLAPALTDHGAFFESLIHSADGKAVEYCEEIAEAFVEQVIARKPDGLILSGDLTFNGEKTSHEALAEKLRRIQAAGIPVFVLPGNHDMENSMAASFHNDGYTRTESVTPEEFPTLYQAFGYETALVRDEHSLSYTAQLSPGLRLLMLDVNGTSHPGSIPAETLSWVEEQLSAAQADGAALLSVSHQNLLQHNSGFAAGFVMGGNDRLLDLLEQYGAICHFSGHIHLQHIAQSEKGLPEIVTSSLLVSPLQYGVLRLEETAGQYRTEQVEVSPEIEAYARDFFWDTAYRQAQRALKDDPALPDMAAYFADINTAYFAGRMDTAAYDTDTLQAWAARDTFLSAYLQSMADDAGADYTTFDWNF